MPKYPNSEGEMIDKKVIDGRIARAKEDYKQKFYDEHGFFFCERTLRSDLKLDPSHIVSVKWSQENSMCELAYCPNNFEYLTRDEHLKFEMLPNKVRLSWYNERKNGMTFENFLLFNNIEIKSHGQNELF